MIPAEGQFSQATSVSRRHVLPTFLVVGAPKTGTTSLYHYLKQHPQIFMSPVKEPSYFCTEIRPEYFSEPSKSQVTQQAAVLRSHLRDAKPGTPPRALITEWEDYELLFRNAGAERASGECSACYLWSVSAPGNIRSRLPHVKIVMILRDPAERAFSHYLDYLTAGHTNAPFREHVERAVRGTTREQSALYPFLQFGLYYQQVQRYLNLFPRDQIRIVWYEEAWSEPMQFLANLFEFLDVRTFDLDMSKRHRDRRTSNIHYLLKKYGIGQ